MATPPIKPKTTRLTTDALIGRADAMVADTGRHDLTELLAQTRRRWDDPSTRVMIVGEFKQGKSALVNSMLNAPVCKVGDDVSTAVPTIVAYAEHPAAVVVDAADRPDVPTVEDVRRTDVSMDKLADWQAGEHEAAGRRIQHLEVGLPRDLLKRGLTVVDTPGVGGLRSSHGAATVAALPMADAVFFVSDATAEYSATELDFLAKVLANCPNVTCLVTKTDLQPDWRRIVELNRGHLERAGIDAPILAVSSLVRDLAVRLRDPSLNEESGFADLDRHIEQDLLGRSRMLAHRSVCRDVLTACDNLKVMLGPELAALDDPSRLPELVGRLEQAQQEAEELRNRSARWQTTLNDGVADLNSDLEHDLKDRMRALVRDSEASIDSGDPGAVWDDFSAWLEGRCAEVLGDTFTWAESNTSWLISTVGEHFTAEVTGNVPTFAVADTTGLLDLAPAMSDLDRGRLHLGQKVLIGMRGSYGGVLMFGLLTSLAGMALVNPFSIGAGLLLGAKAYHDEKEARLKRRQAEAKNAVRRYLDEVQFQVLKTLRDRLRLVQRGLRDYYLARADELQRSIADSLDSARAAIKASHAERAERKELLRTKLSEAERLGKAMTNALAPATVGAAA